MTQDLEKAKKIINKNFCLMQWQADDAKKRGEELMGKEDIEFLLSLNSITKEEHISFDALEGRYNSDNLFKAIKNSKDKGLKGLLMIGTTLNQKDSTALKEMGYFIRYEWLGSTMCDEIYFSEEAFIRAEISRFKHFFGCIGEAVQGNLI